MVSRTNKFRGSRTHGRGRKSGRGAGIHGGRGNAGLHKHKYMHTLKYDPLHFGVHGFKRPAKVVEEVRSITLRTLLEQLPSLIESSRAAVQGEVCNVDLGSLGFQKLIGNAVVDRKINITVARISARARAAVESAGGSVTLK